MKKLFSISKTTIIQICYLVGLYGALRDHSAVAWNLVRFYLWLQFVAFSTTLVLGQDFFEENPDRAKLPTFPSWIANTIDIIAIVALAAYGHFLYAGLVTASMIFSAVYVGKIKKFLDGKKK